MTKVRKDDIITTIKSKKEHEMKEIEEILKNTEEIKELLSEAVPPLSGGTEKMTKEETVEQETMNNKDETHPKVNLRLKKNLKEKLDDLAAQHGMHTATYVRTLCYMAIANSANLGLEQLDMKSELKKLEKEFV